MSRRKVLASVLWLGAVGCGDDTVHHLADAPPMMHEDAPGPQASFATSMLFATTCGEVAPQPQALVITNTGTETLAVMNFAVTGGFDVSGLDVDHPLIIQPNGTGTLMVTPPATVIGTDVPGQMKLGELGLSTNIAATLPTIELAATVMGAALVIVDAGNTPETIALSADNACPAPLATFVRNTGNIAVSIGAPQSTGFLASAYSGGLIDPGTSQEIDFRVVTDAQCAATGSVTFAVSSAGLCNGDSSGASFVAGASFAISNASTCFCS